LWTVEKNKNKQGANMENSEIELTIEDIVNIRAALCSMIETDERDLVRLSSKELPNTVRECEKVIESARETLSKVRQIRGNTNIKASFQYSF
jgi:hypothetical protein